MDNNPSSEEERTAKSNTMVLYHNILCLSTRKTQYREKRGLRYARSIQKLLEDAKKSDMTPILYIEGQAKALLCTLKAEYLCLGSYTGDGSERLPATGRIGAQRQPVNTRS